MAAEKLTQCDSNSLEHQNGRPLSPHERDLFEAIENGQPYDDLTTLIPPESRTIKQVEHAPHNPITEVVDEVNPGALWQEARTKNRVGSDKAVEQELTLSEESLSALPPLMSGDERAKGWEEKQKLSWIPTDVIPTEEAFYNFERFFARPGKKAEIERQEELEQNQNKYKDEVDEVAIEYPRDARGIVGWLTKRFQIQPTRERMTLFEARRTYGLVGVALMRLNNKGGRTPR